jgi:hypothetical protein
VKTLVPNNLTERVTKAARKRTDRERRLYVTTRKALNPRATVTRRSAARKVATSPIEIPHDRGFLVLEAGRLHEATAVAQAAQEALAGTSGDAVRSTNKEFMVPVVDTSTLTADSPFMRFALHPDVIAGVTTYLGVAPVLSAINVFSSKSAKTDAYKSSQLWHCDGDDTKQIKIFVLCSEVTEANGPTVIMDAERSARIRREVSYEYRNRVTDEEAERILGDDLVDTHITGAPGTVAIMDTSRCFHYGSRVEADAEPRLAAVFQYLTPFSFMLPRDPRNGAPYRHLAQPGDDRLRRLVLGAE